MILDNDGPDESAFFSPDDVPTSEGAETDGLNGDAEYADPVEGDADYVEPELDENGEPIAKPEEPEQAKDEEFEEIEHEGKKHKLPKELKPLLMMQQDYTRKTQEVAEQRKSLEQHQAEVQAKLSQQVQFAQQFTAEIAELHNVDKRLAEYSKVDWQAWREQNFMDANAGFQEYQILKDQRQQLAGSLTQKQQQARQEAEHRSREAQQQHDAEIAKRREETVRTIKQAIPGWNEEVASKVSGFAQQVGYSREDLINASTDPRAFILLHKAWRGEQLEAQQKAAALKAKANIQPQAQPLTPVAKGRAAPATSGLDDRLSPEEWVRRRQEQLRNRR
jgi:hypothetical protein